MWREGMAEWLPYANVANEISQAGAPAPAAGVATASVVKCPTCGKPAAANELIPVGNTQVCPSCKEEYVQSAREGVSMGGEWEYGGFWIRTGAVMVDGMITGSCDDSSGRCGRTRSDVGAGRFPRSRYISYRDSLYRNLRVGHCLLRVF